MTYFLFFLSFQILPLVVEVVRILPLMLFLIIYWETGRDVYLAIGILTFFGLLVLLTLTALVPTGSRNPGRLERIARYAKILTPDKLNLWLVLRNMAVFECRKNKTKRIELLRPIR